jgi:predicted RNase H-like HicB family nuclease
LIEKGSGSYGAYVPDLPGCVAAAKTLPEVKRLIAQAIRFHLDGLHSEGLPVPAPSSLCEYVEA